jgi:hypothetical protein
MVTGQAAAPVEHLTWDAIRVRYPDRWVVLDNIGWVNDTDFELTGADVLAAFETRKAASPTMKSLIASRHRVGCFFTGELVPQFLTSINLLIAK